MAGNWKMALTGHIGFGGSTSPDRSINGQFQDGTGSYATISLNDTKVRDIAFKRTANSTIELPTDFRGKQYAPFGGYSNGGVDVNFSVFPVAKTNSGSYYSPISGTGSSDNTQSTNSSYTRIARHTADQYTAGTSRVVHIRITINSSGNTYNGDLQVFGIIHKASNGSTKAVYVPGKYPGPDWKTSTTSSSSISMQYISTNVSSTSSRFKTQGSNTPSPSSGCGRIKNPFNASSYGNGNPFFETTGMSNSSYAHLKSPTIDIASGDVLDVYYGIDAPSVYAVTWAIRSP